MISDLIYALVHVLLLFLCRCSPFSVTGIAPNLTRVTVWMDTTGADQDVRLNYTVIELFPTDITPVSLSGTHNDLRTSFDVHGLKPETWYGLHMSIRYSWRGAQHSEPAHDVAFKTLPDLDDNDNDDNSTNATSGSPVVIAARPISGGFELRMMNQLGDRLRSPMEAYVTSTCAGEVLGGRYNFTSDQPPQQSKVFLLNNTQQLPDKISNQDPSEWAMDACENVCWSLFVSAAGVSYVLDSQCANLTEVFVNTGSDLALWGETEDGDDKEDTNTNSSAIQKRSGVSSYKNEQSSVWMMVLAIVFVFVTF